MSYLTQYKKKDFVRISWLEYEKTINILYRKVSKYLKKNKIQVDAVVPILRGGAFPGTWLAFKLSLVRILPIQFKYFFNGKKIELKKMHCFSKKEMAFTKKPVFLLVENNHCFGVTAENVAKEMKKMFPKSTIIYAADYMDYPYQKNKCADVIFYGKLTNETRKLTEKQCKKLGISNKSSLFPWENIEEEWTTVQGKQFKYADLQKSIKSKTKLTLQ